MTQVKAFFHGLAVLFIIAIPVTLHEHWQAGDAYMRGQMERNIRVEHCAVSAIDIYPIPLLPKDASGRHIRISAGTHLTTGYYEIIECRGGFPNNATTAFPLNDHLPVCPPNEYPVAVAGGSQGSQQCRQTSK